MDQIQYYVQQFGENAPYFLQKTCPYNGSYKAVASALLPVTDHFDAVKTSNDETAEQSIVSIPLLYIPDVEISEDDVYVSQHNVASPIFHQDEKHYALGAIIVSPNHLRLDITDNNTDSRPTFSSKSMQSDDDPNPHVAVQDIQDYRLCLCS